MLFTLDRSDIEAQAESLVIFHSAFTSFFQTATRDVSTHALDYLKGQLLCESRRNMHRMSREVTQKNTQALSHFVSNSPWPDAPLLSIIAHQAADLMGTAPGKEDRGLLIDESGIAKQGTASVGVARQYCGALGKVDNCQMGVFLAYSAHLEATLIDRRLYLPQAWIDDPQRCKKAGIPRAFQVFRTKAELALDMILGAKEEGIPFSFVGFDAHYGEQPFLLTRLEHEDIVYVADIPCDSRVYLDYPIIDIPKRRSTRGRAPSIPRVLKGKAFEVRALLPFLSFHTLEVRDSQRGKLFIRFAALQVFRIEGELPRLQPLWLLIRQEIDGKETKFSFSNAPFDTPLEILAKRQSRRYFVERALQDGKGLAGLDEYQVQGWRGWHHHMTIVILAMLFLLQLKQSLCPKASMITLQDALDILKVVLPKKQLSLQDAVDLIKDKHLNRWRSRNSYLRKQLEQLKAERLIM